MNSTGKGRHELVEIRVPREVNSFQFRDAGTPHLLTWVNPEQGLALSVVEEMDPYRIELVSITESDTRFSSLMGKQGFELGELLENGEWESLESFDIGEEYLAIKDAIHYMQNS